MMEMIKTRVMRVMSNKQMRKMHMRYAIKSLNCKHHTINSITTFNNDLVTVFP